LSQVGAGRGGVARANEAQDEKPQSLFVFGLFLVDDAAQHLGGSFEFAGVVVVRSEHRQQFRAGLAGSGGLLPMRDGFLDLLAIDRDATEQDMGLAFDRVILGRR
jgi:hypothetical protein